MAGKDYNDFYDDVPTEEESNAAEPQETPEQIEAREIQQQTIERGSKKMRNAIVILVAAAVLMVILWLTIEFAVPFVSEAQQRGAITQVRHEGMIFKTFEGQMVTDERLADTIHVYQRDFFFSVENDSVARDLMKLQSTGRRVTLTYKEYRGALPWRGNSKIIVTGYSVE